MKFYHFRGFVSLSYNPLIAGFANVMHVQGKKPHTDLVLNFLVSLPMNVIF